MFSQICDETKLYELVRVHVGSVDLDRDIDKHEYLVLHILRQFENTWLEAEMKEERRVFLWRDEVSDEVSMDGLRQTLSQLGLNEVDYAIGANSDQVTTQRLVIFSRIIDAWHHGQLITKSDLDQKLSMGLLLADLLGGTPDHLDGRLQEQHLGLFEVFKRLNNAVLIKQHTQEYEGFRRLAKELYLLLNDPRLLHRDHDEYFHDLVTLGAAGMLIHLLVIILRRHRSIDQHLSQMIWGKTDRLMSMELAHSLKFVF